MASFWKDFEGTTIGARYTLDELLSSDDSGAFFRTAAESGERLLIRLVPADTDGDHRPAGWSVVHRLEHPNLLALIDSDSTESAAGPIAFAVFEYPDDSAASAIAQGPMSEQDAQEIFAAARGALRYLHQNGLVHTAVDPGHIVAVGDKIKLSSDTVRKESVSHSPQDDLRALGATLYELLTARRVMPGDEPDAARLSEPFRSIISNLRRGEWEAPIAAAPPAVPGAPALSPQRSYTWIYAAAGLLLLVVAVLVLARGRSPEPELAASAPPVTTPVPAPPPASVAAPERKPEPKTAPASLPKIPVRAAPKPEANRKAEPAAPTAKNPRPYWRVVAYTYSRKQDAERKAQSINERWPNFDAEVITPSGSNNAPYLVALGGRMTRPDALRLRQQARRQGLPRDTFVQNYSR